MCDFWLSNLLLYWSSTAYDAPFVLSIQLDSVHQTYKNFLTWWLIFLLIDGLTLIELSRTVIICVWLLTIKFAFILIQHFLWCSLRSVHSTRFHTSNIQRICKMYSFSWFAQCKFFFPLDCSKKSNISFCF